MKFNYKVQSINNKTGKVNYLKHCETGKRRKDMVWKNLQDAEYALDVAMYQKWEEGLLGIWGQKDENNTWSIVKVEDASNCS